MFVYYYAHLALPFEVVERGLFDLLATGADDWAADAYREGEDLRVKLGLGSAQPRIGKSVRIIVSQPRRSIGETSVPITWETSVAINMKATGLPGLFPKLEGDLVVAGLGPELTQVAIRGSYNPPLGLVGRALDRTLLHRVAEASVKGFLDRVAGAIQSAERGSRNGGHRPGPAAAGAISST